MDLLIFIIGSEAAGAPRRLGKGNAVMKDRRAGIYIARLPQRAVTDEEIAALACKERAEQIARAVRFQEKYYHTTIRAIDGSAAEVER